MKYLYINIISFIRGLEPLANRGMPSALLSLERLRHFTRVLNPQAVLARRQEQILKHGNRSPSALYAGRPTCVDETDGLGL